MGSSWETASLEIWRFWLDQEFIAREHDSMEMDLSMFGRKHTVVNKK